METIVSMQIPVVARCWISCYVAHTILSSSSQAAFLPFTTNHNLFLLSQELQKKHNQETERLQKKLRWYAENQELLDRDAAALKEKDAELKRLQLQLQLLQTDVSETEIVLVNLSFFVANQ